MRIPYGSIKQSMFTKRLPDLLGQALYETAEMIRSEDKSFTTLARIEAVKSLACQYYKTYGNKLYQPKQAFLTALTLTGLPSNENAHIYFLVSKDNVGQSLLIVDGTLNDFYFKNTFPFAVLAIKFVT